MNRVAIAFSSKDRVDLTKRTIEPLLQPDKFDLYWCDGSLTEEGQAFHDNHHMIGPKYYPALFGGSCRYIVFALTQMLKTEDNTRAPDGFKINLAKGEQSLTYPPQYDYVALVENDVLLDPDWFEPTMALFEQGKADGLKVGAVSARCYEDRILIQRPDYAIMHNLGAGAIIFTREAAELILQTYRTGWTTENRRIFSMLSGIDIGSYWAFRGGEHPLVADWSWDHILASHGLCSLALTPAKATQLEDIAAMGLKMADAPVEARRNDEAFKLFVERSAQIRSGALKLPIQPNNRLYHDGAHVIFPHQIEQIGGAYSGEWWFKWSLGYGCFAWKAGGGEGPSSELNWHGSRGKDFVVAKQLNQPTVEFFVIGPLDVLVSGGEQGGKILIEDTHSGFSCDPHLQPEINGNILQVSVPGAYAYRTIRITALTPGVVFYGIRTRDAQPSYLAKFDFNTLPPL
jgi:hypothetical protein